MGRHGLARTTYYYRTTVQPKIKAGAAAPPKAASRAQGANFSVNQKKADQKQIVAPNLNAANPEEAIPLAVVEVEEIDKGTKNSIVTECDTGREKTQVSMKKKAEPKKNKGQKEKSMIAATGAGETFPVAVLENKMGKKKNKGKKKAASVIDNGSETAEQVFVGKYELKTVNGKEILELVCDGKNTENVPNIDRAATTDKENNEIGEQEEVHRSVQSELEAMGILINKEPENIPNLEELLENVVESYVTVYEHHILEEKCFCLEMQLYKHERAKKDLETEVEGLKKDIDKYEKMKEAWDTRDNVEKEKRYNQASEKLSICHSILIRQTLDDHLTDVFKNFIDELEKFERQLYVDPSIAVEPQLSDFDALKLFSREELIRKLIREATPFVVENLRDNLLTNFEGVRVESYVRLAFEKDLNVTLETITLEIASTVEPRSWTEVQTSSKSSKSRASSSSHSSSSSSRSSPPGTIVVSSSLQPPANEASPRLSNRPSPNQSKSSTPASSKKTQRKKITQQWKSTNKLRQVDLSDYECSVCLEAIGSSKVHCEFPSCNEPYHPACLSKMWKTGMQECPKCRGAMPNRGEFPTLGSV